MDNENIPGDVLENIFSRLDLHDAGRLRVINHDWDRIVSTEMFLDVYNSRVSQQIRFFSHVLDPYYHEQYGVIWCVHITGDIRRNLTVDLREILRGHIIKGDIITLISSYGVLFLFRVLSCAQNNHPYVRLLLLVNIISSRVTQIVVPHGLHFNDRFHVVMVPNAIDDGLGFQIVYVQVDSNGVPRYSVYASQNRRWIVTSLAANRVTNLHPSQIRDSRRSMILVHQQFIYICTFDQQTNPIYQIHTANDFLFPPITPHNSFDDNHHEDGEWPRMGLVRFGAGTDGRWCIFMARLVHPTNITTSHLDSLLLARMRPNLTGYELVSRFSGSNLDSEDNIWCVFDNVAGLQIQQRGNTVHIGFLYFSRRRGWMVSHLRYNILANNDDNWDAHDIPYGEDTINLDLPYFPPTPIRWQ